MKIWPRVSQVAERVTGDKPFTEDGYTLMSYFPRNKLLPGWQVGKWGVDTWMLLANLYNREMLGVHMVREPGTSTLRAVNKPFSWVSAWDSLGSTFGQAVWKRVNLNIPVVDIPPVKLVVPLDNQLALCRAKGFSEPLLWISGSYALHLDLSGKAAVDGVEQFTHVQPITLEVEL